MKSTKPFIEAIIVAIVFVTIWLLGIDVTKNFFVQGQLDINLHDTYFITKFSWKTDVLLPSLFIIMVIYFIRSGINRFKSRLQNGILLVSILALNLLMLPFLEQTAKSAGRLSHGWTIYPPLSRLGEHQLPATSPFDGMLQILFISQII